MRQSQARIGSRKFRCVRASALIIACAALAGCGAVGTGVAPNKLSIQPANGAIGDATTTVFQCFVGTLNATLFFSDGSIGGFTNSAQWASSNPSVVRVSNGDIPVPGQTGSVYVRGTLVPVAPGTATVTASFDNLHASIQVTVDTPSNLQIRKLDQQRPVSASSVTIAPGSTQALTIVGDFNGVERDVRTQATWSIATPNSAVATVDSATGIVSAVAAGGPLTVQASFPTCGTTPSIPVTVAPIQTLVLQPAFGSDPLIVGDIERFDVFADFSNGLQQDLSTQATLTSSDTSVAAFSAAPNPNFLASVKAGGPLTISASFGSGSAEVQAAPVTVNLVSAGLQFLTLTPSETSLVAASAPQTQYPGTNSQAAQFRAIGTFDNGQTQDVTDKAAWSSSDTTVAVLSSQLPTSGLATAAGGGTGTVTVTAQDTRATENPLATAQLDVLAP